MERPRFLCLCVVVTLFGACGCGSGSKRRTVASGPAAPAAPPGAQSLRPPRPAGPELTGGVRCIDAGTGRISAVTLGAFLKKGPGFLLQGLSVERYPPREEGSFKGWRIKAVTNACLRRALRPDDIILSVNGVVIARPFDLWNVWVSLRNAAFLHLVMIRGGRLQERRLQVVR